MLRFAPSPTGDMHIEELRIAIFSYSVARQRDTQFIIRIEDTDKERNIEGKDTEILQILEKFALTHDAVFHQSEHLNIHQTLAIRLLEEGKAFICTCTPEQLEAEREKAKNEKKPYRYSGRCIETDKERLKTLREEKAPFVIRIKKPKEKILYHDGIQGSITTLPDEIDAFVILHADGTPSQIFASACDDMLSGVDTIVRREKDLFMTAKQKYIQTLLGYEEETTYTHLPTILAAGDTKETPLSVKWLFEQGFIPDAIANYLIALGNRVPQEIFTLPEALEWFDLASVSNSVATFDMEQLRTINRKHLELMDDKRLSMVFGFADASIGKLAKLYLEEAATLNELEIKIKAIFSPKTFQGSRETEMRTLEKIIAEAPMIETFNEFKSYIIKESGLEEKHISTPLRLLLTGTEEGPALSQIYPYIKSYLLEVAS